jgi:phage shock protein PspC (stress-responsive transcriptional regulator)
MSENPTQQPMQAPPPPAPPAPKRLLRSRNDRWIAGVCGGIGEYAGVDPNLVRLLAVVGAVFSAGTLFLAYVVAWIVMPEG